MCFYSRVRSFLFLITKAKCFTEWNDITSWICFKIIQKVGEWVGLQKKQDWL